MSNDFGNLTSPAFGDIVLLHDQGRPRGQWKIAVVEEEIQDSDGHIRGAVIRVCSKSGQPISLRR
jgi:hypothetical protein